MQCTIALERLKNLMMLKATQNLITSTQGVKQEYFVLQCSAFQNTEKTQQLTMN
jgi:hypothetical protein